MSAVSKKVVTEEPVEESRTDASGAPNVILARLVWLATSVVIVILAIRFIFILLGASSANGFVSFIYSISAPLARPFFGIFGYSLHYGIARFEAASLVAIAIYGIAGYLIGRLLTINRPQTTV
jgi:hypothetical protein